MFQLLQLQHSFQTMLSKIKNYLEKSKKLFGKYSRLSEFYVGEVSLSQLGLFYRSKLKAFCFIECRLFIASIVFKAFSDQNCQMRACNLIHQNAFTRQNISINSVQIPLMLNFEQLIFQTAEW